MKRADDLLLFLGRLAFAALFIPDGLSKVENFARFAASLGHRGLAFPNLLAMGAVLSELGGSLLLVIGYQAELGALLIILFCVAANMLQHRYWEVAEPARNAAQLQFYKNLALCGGLLFFWVSGPGGWSVWRLLSRERRKLRNISAAG